MIAPYLIRCIDLDGVKYVMIQELISKLIGPSGMKILAWYVDNNMYVNGAIVLVAVVYLLFPKKGQEMADKLRQLYLRSPLAPDENDRQLIEKYKSLSHKRSKSKRSNGK